MGASFPARAVDGPRPRVPPLFPRAQCLTVVDRSEDAFIEVSVPYEDEATDVELPDARTTQLFAVCDDPGYGGALPPWVSWDDVERARSAGLLAEEPSNEEVLETSEAWPLHACVMQVSERRPSTCDGLDGGSAWDLADVPIGNYVIHGYVFAPAMNVWTRRPGIVRVVDGTEEPGPVVNLMTAWRRAEAYQHPGIVIEGCAAGDASLRVSLEWSSLQDQPMQWTRFAEHEGPGSFEVSFEPPAGAQYQALLVRAVARDNAGRQWIAMTEAEIIVLPECGPADPGLPSVTSDACGLAEEPPAPPADPQCESEDPAMEPDEPEPPDASSDGQLEDESSDGSGCNIAPFGAAALPWPFGLLALFLTRRRKTTTRPAA